ncbi:MAG: hypothetical protein AAGC60_20030 [Acidobacteriota bacterium]
MNSAADTQPADRLATDDTFDPMRFARTWIVIEGDSGIGTEIHIEYEEAKKHFILCRENRAPVQVLRYDAIARTLVDAEEQGPYRCISFWDQPIRGKFRIFAMRLPRLDDASDPSACLLPWELESPDRGTWGAEEG